MKGFTAYCLFPLAVAILSGSVYSKDRLAEARLARDLFHHLCSTADVQIDLFFDKYDEPKSEKLASADPEVVVHIYLTKGLEGSWFIRATDCRNGVKKRVKENNSYDDLPIGLLAAIVSYLISDDVPNELSGPSDPIVKQQPAHKIQIALKVTNSSGETTAWFGASVKIAELTDLPENFASAVRKIGSISESLKLMIDFAPLSETQQSNPLPHRSRNQNEK